MIVAGDVPAVNAESPAMLTPHEEQIGSQIGFEKEILRIIKDEVNSPLHQLSGYDEDGYQVKVNGIVISSPQSKVEQVRVSLRNKLLPWKYMVFLVEVNEGTRIARIGIIKGTDQFEILNIMQTNGEPDDITHDDVIEKLREWDKLYPFEIIGAENEWVELEFKKLPRDVKAFAEDVYGFSPDTIDNGAGTINDLIAELKQTRRVTLWWE